MTTTYEPGMPVMVEIAGKSYQIRFSLKSMKTLQAEHKIHLLRGGMSDLDPEKLALILYFGLRDKNPELTLDWVEENVDAAALVDMVPALRFAINGSAAPSGTLPNGAPPVPTGTGSASGPSADTTSVLVNGRSGS